MKKIKGIAALLLICILTVTAFAGCGTKTEDKETSTQEGEADTTDQAASTTEAAPDATALSGTLLLSGSTSMEKLANVAAESFMIKYPEVTISAEFIGSSAGVEAVLAGTVDIGNASRNLKDAEVSAGAVENIVAIDGIAVITDNSNTATNLTKEQLVKIYTGEITNWKDVGGSDQPIVVIGREAGSGTRGAFEELLEIEDLCKYSNEINSTGGVMAKVASTIGAIGYVSLDVLDDSIIALQLEGVEPTAENIKAGSYFLSRPFVMATRGEISEQNELVQAFFEYLKSEEGKQMIKSVGLITLD
ncbi:MAG: phosphate transporter substrate-binding protein [Herbinix sp.]|jgi:phosphate transport system substrate-binding protein|nr:phosphate transporter substrate-binding protein [Herbinix sp.]